MNKQKWILTVIAISLTSCTSLDMPDIKTSTDNVSQYKNLTCASAPTSKKDLCKSYAKAEFYKSKYGEMAGESYNTAKYFDAVMFISTLTAAVGVSWNLHPDYYKVAAYTLSSALAGKAYVDPKNKAALFLRGVESMQCVTATSSLILNSVDDTTELQSIRDSLDDKFKVLTKLTLVTEKNVAVKTKNLEYAANLDELNNARQQLLNQQAQIEQTVYQVSLLVKGMHGLVDKAVEDTSLNLKKRFIESAPDMNAILSIINTTTSNMASDMQKSQVIANIPQTSNAINGLKSPESAEDISNSLQQVANAIDSIKDNHKKLMEMKNTYSTVETSLKLCSAIM
ncbi:hypothetical protein [Shewanella frigidimarina]|uniref:hypothetical protein n=1 Tax=Shewanella frigidimarina TaxID=56812 RepID=UPI003F9EE993